ncbi:recombination protein NinG [Ectopseudomonas mendocina]|uniref:Recombination protein NinG n=1 Tax=Ectopseudomonas mendocina TaxID=300 RepID=A0ABZ2RGX0_ECTME
MRTCRAPFVPSQTFQTWCGPECGLVIARAKQDKERKALAQVERREIKAAKERIKSRGDYLREAQTAFNAWVRARDAQLPCVSCGRHHQGQWHAGHYRTVGSTPELRFEPLNVHKQCAPCNNHMSGNVVEYRINLVRKIGLEAVEWLEGPHEPKKYTVDEIKAIKAHYRALVRELKRGVA